MNKMVFGLLALVGACFSLHAWYPAYYGWGWGGYPYYWGIRRPKTIVIEQPKQLVENKAKKHVKRLDKRVTQLEEQINEMHMQMQILWQENQLLHQQNQQKAQG